MDIKSILDEIAAEGGSNAKMEILKKHKGSALLVSVLYKACSKRVKFYIKQIPSYVKNTGTCISLDYALDAIDDLSSRKFTGHAAASFLKVLLEALCPDDAYVLERVIEKDLKIGIGTTNINKVIPGLIEKTPKLVG